MRFKDGFLDAVAPVDAAGALWVCGIVAALVGGFWFVMSCQAASFGGDCSGPTKHAGDTCEELTGDRESVSFEEGQEEVADGKSGMKIAVTIFVIGVGLIAFGVRRENRPHPDVR
ncbi:hypothetical protein [Streptomyces sp. NBC_01304]|uniref:hypothetical protein n=1 Tax=Streptomyces sp. NBC_01304 TaxID=2903818 RepID=UPI002E0E0AA4|nr:hypothetical protein OG430_01485 [Streptomyces sp. NBC_01304]